MARDLTVHSNGAVRSERMERHVDSLSWRTSVFTLGESRTTSTSVWANVSSITSLAASHGADRFGTDEISSGGETSTPQISTFGP